MLVIRPVRPTDLDALVALAHLTGFGLTTLPHDRNFLTQRIQESQQAFHHMPEHPRGDYYLFVLEDTSAGRVVGTCGITTKVGGFEPFYAYRIETNTLVSEMLDVEKEIRTLTLVAEHSGPCEIGSLFLHPDFRRDGRGGAGRLLSLARFLFMAEHRLRFEPIVIAEMRGVIDDHGHSPFWDAVGKHFFEIDFPKADFLSMVNKKFIADLMPRHPLYVSLLPPAAQAVIGRVHPDTRPALRLLESEGFRITDMVDIFEAGPVVSARRDDIRTVKESRRAVVEQIAALPESAPAMHILHATADPRITRGRLEVLPGGTVRVDAQAAQALELQVGASVRWATPTASILEKGLP